MSRQEFEVLIRTRSPYLEREIDAFAQMASSVSCLVSACDAPWFVLYNQKCKNQSKAKRYNQRLEQCLHFACCVRRFIEGGVDLFCALKSVNHTLRHRHRRKTTPSAWHHANDRAKEAGECGNCMKYETPQFVTKERCMLCSVHIG